MKEKEKYLQSCIFKLIKGKIMKKGDKKKIGHPSQLSEWLIKV